MINKKLVYGQFFTKGNWWIKDKEHIQNFIMENSSGKFLDPFLGDGDLLKTMKNELFSDKVIDVTGFDIDISLVKKMKNIFKNDSLISLENKFYDKTGTFVVTNPPFLSKSSAKRKNIYENVSKYFSEYNLDDLYKIALVKLIQSGLSGIAIVPESFINSSLFLKLSKNINSVTAIIPNPFEDTDIPVCVVCFNGKIKEKTIFCLNERKIYNIDEFLNFKKADKPKTDITFNDICGQIDLKAIDSNNAKDISFMKAKDFSYSKKKIKISSRVMTYIKMDRFLIKKIGLENIIAEANRILKVLRLKSLDIIFYTF